MVLSRVNIVKLFIFALIFVLMLFYSVNTKFKSNLFEAILPENYTNNSSVLNIMNKTSNNINVIFEGQSEDEVLENKKEFQENIDKSVFEVLSFDIDALGEFYSKSPQNFLSDKAKNDIKNHDYKNIYENAIYNLYSPSAIQFMPFEKDPYFLFNDFIKENAGNYSEVKEIEGKFYTSLNVKIKDQYNFASKNTGKNIGNLIKTTKNAMFCGSLIHSFYTTKYTGFFINLICILSAVFIVILNYYYFKSFRPLLLITFSITFGFLAGFCAVKICFSDFHIITLLFATTLIGIGIDYSFHYFFNKGIDKNFAKNLSFSYLTTAIAFLVMFLSKIELLKQISIFIIFGLLGIYLFVLFVYPVFKIDTKIRSFDFKISANSRKIILSVLLIVFIAGLFKTKFDDSLLNLYSPNKKLKHSEIIHNKLTNKNGQEINFLVNKAQNTELLLQKEEKLNQILKSKNIDFISISKFIPSKKTQEENIGLVKDLYNNNLNSYAEILSEEQITGMKKGVNNLSAVEFNFDNSYFNYFLLGKNKSYTIAYSNDVSGLEKYCDEIINIKTNISNILKNYRHKVLKLLPAVYILIFGFLYIIFGYSKTIKMYLPVLFSGILALSFASLLGFKVNLFSIISVFLVTGFTLDYSIFRFNGNKDSDIAIFTSVITTSFSFLLLSFTPFKLISSMSAVLFFGIVISYITGKIIQDKFEKSN